MRQCDCGSYAINPSKHGRDDFSDLNLCDVCYWKSRADTAYLRGFADARERSGDEVHFNSQAILLAAGEMTASELRCVRAVLVLKERAIRAIKPEEP